MISIDRAINIGVGLGVTLLSISGLMCINNSECKKDDTKSCVNSKKCSKVNMNLGLGSLCAAGGLMVYKNTLSF
jgi:hypothetical protein